MKYSKDRKTNFWIFVSYYGALFVATILECIEKSSINKSDLSLKVISSITRILTFAVEGCLVYLQWSLFIYFIKRKRLQSRVHRSLRAMPGPSDLSAKTKAAITWIIIVLAINTINYAVYHVVQILITVDIFKEQKS